MLRAAGYRGRPDAEGGRVKRLGQGLLSAGPPPCVRLAVCRLPPSACRLPRPRPFSRATPCHLANPRPDLIRARTPCLQSTAPPPSAELKPEELLLPPNSILFVQNVPQELAEQTQPTLTALFKQYGGFKEVRLVPGKSTIAFVEFDSEYTAALAKDALQSFALTPTHLLKITFAKR